MNKNQPYLIKQNEDNTFLLFCGAKEEKKLFFGNEYTIMPWKIYFKKNQEEDTVLITPTQHSEHGDVVIECNPHIKIENDRPVLYYVAGFNKGEDAPIKYFLCSININWDMECYDDTWKVIIPTFTGAYIQNKLFYVEKTINGDVLHIGDVTLGLVFDLIGIYRICPVHNTDYFIITGSTTNKDKSYICTADLSKRRQIKNNLGESVYKCTILDNRLIYTIKHDTNTEVRSLIEDTFNYQF